MLYRILLVGGDLQKPSDCVFKGVLVFIMHLVTALKLTAAARCLRITEMPLITEISGS